MKWMSTLRDLLTLDEQGHRVVVKNGYHPAREVTTGIGKIPIKHSRREGEHFTSAILPKSQSEY